jgi:hypothetical protein
MSRQRAGPFVANRSVPQAQRRRSVGVPPPFDTFLIFLLTIDGVTARVPANHFFAIH